VLGDAGEHGRTPGVVDGTIGPPDDVAAFLVDAIEGGQVVFRLGALVALVDEGIPIEEGRGGESVAGVGLAEVFDPLDVAVEVECGDVVGVKADKDETAVGGRGGGGATGEVRDGDHFRFAAFEPGDAFGRLDSGGPEELSGGTVEAIDFLDFRGGAGQEDAIAPENGGTFSGQGNRSGPEDVLAGFQVPGDGPVPGRGDAERIRSPERGPVLGEIGRFGFGCRVRELESSPDGDDYEGRQDQQGRGSDRQDNTPPGCQPAVVRGLGGTRHRGCARVHVCVEERGDDQGDETAGKKESAGDQPAVPGEDIGPVLAVEFIVEFAELDIVRILGDLIPQPGEVFGVGGMDVARVQVNHQERPGSHSGEDRKEHHQ